MNDHTEANGMERDATVTARYAASKKITAPEHLDNVILKDAARAVTRQSRAGWTSQWLRPAAYVASFCLCLALLLNISETPLFNASDLPPGQTSEPGLPASGDSGRALRKATSNIAQQIDDASLAAGPTQQGLSKEGYQNSTASCGTAERRSAQSWATCINHLQAQGNDAAVEAELQQLQNQYPEFDIEPLADRAE